MGSPTLKGVSQRVDFGGIFSFCYNPPILTPLTYTHTTHTSIHESEVEEGPDVVEFDKSEHTSNSGELP